MCREHWDLVPEEQQRQVVALFDASLRGRTSSIRHLAAEEYRKAREAAIAAVNASVAGLSKADERSRK